jgi:hypothetical protein
MALKVHPGIGIARVGDSPEFFVGPETVDLPDPPAGGYRDDNLRIRRQAARFRLFDHNGGAFTAIVDSPATTITWTVTLGSAGASASVTGTNANALIIVGGVTRGELRTDADGHLLVLSPVIGPATGDGRIDGSVEASLSTTNGVETAASSWVSIVPPDFAPGRYPGIPYLFAVMDRFVTLGFATPPPDGVNVSFRRMVYPLVRGRTQLSAADLLALDAAGLATTPLNTGSSGLVVDGAYINALVDRFREGEFTNDFATPVSLEPDELDRGPLSHVDAAGGFAGWELDGAPLQAAVTYVPGELRFANINFGQSAAYFADFRTDMPFCHAEWVSPTQAPAGYGDDWLIRGFMVRDAAGLQYEEWTPTTELLTTALDFGTVPRGSGVARAIDIDLANFYESQPVLEFTVLPAGFTVLRTVEFSGQIHEAGTVRKFWVFFRAEIDAPLGPVNASLTLELQGTAHVIPLTAEVALGDTVQLGLVLDCSASMNEDRGDGMEKFLGLKNAVDVLVQVARPGDGIAVAPFSDDAILPTHVGRTFGDASDPRRQAVIDYVALLQTQNMTSIGDGLVSIESTLAATPDSFDDDAIIVITDGKETAPQYIDDVSNVIDSRTFAVGIGIGGSGGNIDDATLQELTGGHQGYLLLTGNTVSGENSYRLEKYLLQILAGATNETVVLDPTGSIAPGGVVRIAIPITEAEFRLDAIVVSDQAAGLALWLEGPDGSVHSFESFAGMPHTQVVRKPRVGMVRVPTPLKFANGNAWGPGSWYLLITQAKDFPDAAALVARRVALQAATAGQRRRAISYAAIINARSIIQLDAQVSAGTIHDARFRLEATPSFAGVPFLRQPTLQATITTPSGRLIELPMMPVESGRFVAQFDTPATGLHSILFRASGYSPLGHRFVREITLTATLRSPDACCGKRRGAEKLPGPRDKGSHPTAGWLKRLIDAILRLLGLQRRTK